MIYFYKKYQVYILYFIQHFASNSYVLKKNIERNTILINFLKLN